MGARKVKTTWKLIVAFLFCLACAAQNSSIVQTAFATATVDAPTITPLSPYTGGSTSVTITPSTSPATGQTLIYCTDNLDTCAPSIVYAGPITFNGSSTYTYVRAQGTAAGFNNSPITTWQGTYVVQPSYFGQCNNFNSFIGTLSCTLSGANAGDSVNIGLLVNSTTITVSSVTVGGNSCGAAVTSQQTPAPSTLYAYHCDNISAGTNTVTVTLSSAAKLYLSAAELTNVTTSSLDGYGQGVCNSACGTTATSSAITTTQPTDLLWAMCISSTSITLTAGITPVTFTSFPAPSGSSTLVLPEYGQAGTAGSYAPTCRLSASAGWIIVSMGIK
jgi:hypothetical protein